MKGKSYIKGVIRDIRKVRDEQLDGRTRNRMNWWIGNLETGIDAYEDEVEEGKQLGLRNPDFDGDWIGRPDDDLKD